MLINVNIAVKAYPAMCKMGNIFLSSLPHCGKTNKLAYNQCFYIGFHFFWLRELAKKQYQQLCSHNTQYHCNGVHGSVSNGWNIASCQFGGECQGRWIC